MSSLLIYLVEVSLCQGAFYLLFYFVLRKHAFFQANRFYLLLSTFLSFVIPLLSFEVWSSNPNDNLMAFNLPLLSNSSVVTLAASENGSNLGIPFSQLAISLLFITYLAGILFHFTKLIFGLRKVFAFINENPSSTQAKIIRIKNGPAFFSFWKYIFVNEQKLKLQEEELQHVISHEEVHVRQNHTLDILFMELGSVICWFNPFMHKMKEALSQIHEYIADHTVVNGNIGIDRYSQLILQLSANSSSIPLTHQFSKINIKNRITMLNQSNTNKMKALKIFFAIPLLALLLMVFSFTEKASIPTENETSFLQQEKLVIGTITWEGNTKYSDEYLNEIMGLKPGTRYEKENVNNLLSYNPNKTTIDDLYMDNGYLFFNITLEEDIKDGKANLMFKVYEGATVVVDKIIISGNQKVATKEILELVDIKSGDLFNRSKLIASQKNIAESGYFKADNVGINPVPHDGKLMDIEFVVVEL